MERHSQDTADTTEAAHLWGVGKSLLPSGDSLRRSRENKFLKNLVDSSGPF